MNPRLKKLAVKIKEEKLDALFITSQTNITYLTGYPCRDSYLLVSDKYAIFFTDFRYIEEIKKGLTGMEVLQIEGSLFDDIAAICRAKNIRQLGIEERNISLSEYNRLGRVIGKKTALIPTSSLVESFRQIKDSLEIDKIAKSTAITVKALKFIREFLRPGRKEIEIAGELERFIRYAGARTSAFEIIVASGPNSSYPHHMTGSRRVKNNEPVLIDIGVEYLGYKSDLTRVFFLGKISILQKRIYQVVLEAQNKAISRILPGSYVKEVDSAARGHIRACGYGDLFGHSTGHAIGLDGHEAPSLSARIDKKLEAGMVVTVEPGIYLPGEFGIRIEDMVLVTKKGCEVLSGTLNK